jgi:hypothetical protein
MACSTLAAPNVNERCQSDEECPSGFECNLDQGGICLEPPAGRPPRATFAFAVQEGSLDVELRGCDAPVRLDGVELVVDRSDVVQSLELSAEEWVETVDFVCQPGYEPDPALAVCRGPLDATITVRQGSRIGRRRPAPSVVFTAGEAAEQLPWPSDFDGDELPVVAEIRPSLQLPGIARGPFRRWLARGALGSPAVLSAPSRYACHRGIATTLRTTQGDLEAEVSVTARLASAVAAPATVLPAEAAPACADDDTCGEGRVCPPEHDRCGLDLTGTVVATFQSGADGAASAFMYDDCETPSDEVTRSLLLDAAPLPESGLPSVRAATTATFTPNVIGQTPPPTVLEDICLPPWLPAHPVEIELKGAPVEVLDGGAGAPPWICCSLDCLPADGVVDGVSPGNPPLSCAGFEALRLETRLLAAEFDPGGDPTCAPLIADDAGILGRFQTTISGTGIDTACTADGQCTMLAASGEGDVAREHRLAVIQPRESVFRSEILPLAIAPSADELPAITLRPRVQLRGLVACDPGILGCSPAAALVTAERLRLDGDEGLGEEDADAVVGPFTFSTTALADGRFTLPVNPGVYVVTVFPAPGARGGPGRFVLVDLREDAPGVELREGLPVRTLADPLEIEPGRTVRVSLEDFSALTRVFAFDTGTWAEQGDVPMDLNAAGTCWSEDAELGCVIRALNQGIALYASGKTEFTVRDRGSSNCP